MTHISDVNVEYLIEWDQALNFFIHDMAGGHKDMTLDELQNVIIKELQEGRHMHKNRFNQWEGDV